MSSAQRLYGLIGYPLKNTFSADYFNQWFKEKHINARYQNFPVSDLHLLESILPDLSGFNVTIPYKEESMKWVDVVDESAKKCGAINCVKRMTDGPLRGYNTDVIGFRKSLLELLGEAKPTQALVFGTGGSSKAVKVVLDDMGITSRLVSRNRRNNPDVMEYAEVTSEILESHTLLVNCTPVGMFPNDDGKLPIPFQAMHPGHFCFDLIYLPEETPFLFEAKKARARTANGLKMLHYQADAAKQIWFPEQFN